MITNYEKSGMGCMSRSDPAAGWGNFDISLCDGDNFLENSNSSYLLYMWQRWDEVDLVSFSCAYIANEINDNSSFSPDVGSRCVKTSLQSSYYAKIQKEMTRKAKIVLTITHIAVLAIGIVAGSQFVNLAGEGSLRLLVI